jgi:mannose/fructose-specific phosphotransferase system component IIA
MSERLRGVIVSHAAVAEALVEAVGQITGDREALVAVSNEGCSLGTLGERVSAAIGANPAVVFVDLPGGSCLQATGHYMRSHDNVAVVTGVNLAMLIDFVYHRDLSPDDAARRAMESGMRSTRVFSR